MDLVSIIIPTYNRSNKLEKCIESIINQTYENIEIIVSDDGSTDSTQNIIEKLILKYPQKTLKYIKQKNQGAPIARNNGFKISKGKFIIFFDSDDLMMPERVEKQMKAIIKDKANCCACGFNIQKEGKIIRTYLPPTLSEDHLLYQLINGLLHSTQSWIYHRELINEINGYDYSLTAYQDLDLCFRILSLPITKVCIQKEALTTFIDDNDQSRITKKWFSPKSITSMNTVLYKMINSKIIFNEDKLIKAYIPYIIKNAVYYNISTSNYKTIFNYYILINNNIMKFQGIKYIYYKFHLLKNLILYFFKYTLLKYIKPHV